MRGGASLVHDGTNEENCRKAFVVSSRLPTTCQPAPSKTAELIEPFDVNLARHGLSLVRGKTNTLQVNVGFLCNLMCRHCHLEAGPRRREVMTRETMNDVIAYASRVSFDAIDITGGAPEITPNLEYLLRSLAKRTHKIILRTNLVALQDGAASSILHLLRSMGVALVASFPSTNASQADSLRGKGFWRKSIGVLRHLNRQGYGCPGSGLTIDLVVNPVGAFLPGNQDQTERKFKQRLERHGIVFNNLYSFANVPLGRYRAWLEQSGNLDQYFKTLFERFNPAAVEGLMCRSLISVSWDGTLYDCDFNIAAGLFHSTGKIHVSAMAASSPEEGATIATGEHCYACMAGAGFT